MMEKVVVAKTETKMMVSQNEDGMKNKSCSWRASVDVENKQRGRTARGDNRKRLVLLRAEVPIVWLLESTPSTYCVTARSFP